MENPNERESREILERMKTFLSYDPLSGNLVFTDTRFGAVRVGQEAGYLGKDGYRRLYHRGFMYMVHRVSWALYYNKWPEYTIDHINRDRLDNRIENMRDVPQAVNNTNKSKYKKNH